MSALVFMDTETTGLSLTDDIWEFAGIRREPNDAQTELHLFIRHDAAKCSRLPDSFKDDHMRRWVSAEAVTPLVAALRIQEFTAGAHIVGAVPNFDTERIALMLNRFTLVPNWHYHLIDVENLAVGYVMGQRNVAEWTASTGVTLHDIPLPWDSDQLSRLVGVEPPTDARHTAMGDALWAMAIYDRVTGGAA